MGVTWLAPHAPFCAVMVTRKSAGWSTASQENGAAYVSPPPVQDPLVDAYASKVAEQVAPARLPQVQAVQVRWSSAFP